ncbi:PQQ-binding-like beta-propeller repeat protein [Nonomuraea sp. NPDC049758]|uniref:PQQ-binding-like beta-propeller repeat protein n=1 Tax=Nonomuraea sp. NPDC049758 TaxID=3154360 RepID=UPI0034366085
MSPEDMTRRTFAFWGAVSLCSVMGLAGCQAGNGSDKGDEESHRCPSLPDAGIAAGKPVWPVPFSGLRESLSLTGPWLFGTGPDHVIWLRDARSGLLRWRTSTGSAPNWDNGGQPHYPQLLTADGLVLFGGGNGDTTSEVLALCASDGKTMWRRKVPGGPVFEIAGSGDLVAAATQSHIFGLSITTGEILWKAGAQQGRWMKTCDDTLILVNQLGRKFGATGLDRRTGETLWSETISDTSHLDFRVDGDLVHVIGYRTTEQKQDDGTTVMVGIPGKVRTVSTTTNQVVWARTLPPLAGTSPLASNGLLHLTAGERLLALHGRSGKEVWSFPLPVPETNPQMLLHDDLLIANFSAFDGSSSSVRGIDPKTGKEHWRQELGGISGMLAGPSGLALINTDARKVTAIDTAGGEIIWSTPMKGSVQIVAGDLIYAHDGEEISVYDVSTGNTL